MELYGLLQMLLPYSQDAAIESNFTSSTSLIWQIFTPHILPDTSQREWRLLSQDPTGHLVLA